MDLLSLSTITLYRYAEDGSYDEDGLWVESGTPRTITIKGSIQPVWRQSNSGVIMKSLPEGTEIDDVRIVYTRNEVRTASTTNMQQADRVIIDGLTFYAHRMRKWTYYGTPIDHNEVFFVRIHEGRQ